MEDVARATGVIRLIVYRMALDEQFLQMLGDGLREMVSAW